MSDQKDNNIGQWYNPLITNADRENISEELSDKEIEEYDKLWKASRNFSPSSGLKSADRWERFEEMNDEVTIIPMYRSTSFRKAIGAFIAASVLFALLYILRPIDATYDQQFLTSAAQNMSLELPDGSIVKLNAQSELKYSSDQWDEERRVVLSGEAFFEINKNQIPFIVNTGSTNIKVLGTSFNVKYRNDGNVVSCLTGKVSVQTEGNGEVILTKGLATMVIDGQSPLQPYPVDEEEIGSWVNGKFYFNETPLSEVFGEIERQFGVTITSDLDFSSQGFTGYFVNDNLQKSLSIVCLSAGLQFTVDGKVVKVYN